MCSVLKGGESLWLVKVKAARKKVLKRQKELKRNNGLISPRDYKLQRINKEKIMEKIKTENVYSSLIDGKTVNRTLYLFRTDKPSRISIFVADGKYDARFMARLHVNDKDLEPYNYYIDSEGTIIAGIPENTYSHASRYLDNDEKAVTILLSQSYQDSMFPVSDTAIERLVDLCEDICRRNGFLLTFTGDTSGSLTSSFMWSYTGQPGPFMKSKMLEISYRVSNRINGLPDAPTKKKTVYRVRKSWKNHRSSSGVFRDINEAIARAAKTGKNVYDSSGFEVYNHELSSIITLWDNNGKIEIGDIVTSMPCKAEKIPWSNRCYMLEDGIYKLYVPSLGGLVPMDFITQTKESVNRNKDGQFKAGVTEVTLDEGVVEDVEYEGEKEVRIKVHGCWWTRNFIIKKRTNY